MLGRIVMAASVLVALAGPAADAADTGSKGNRTSTTKTQTWHQGERVIPGQRGSEGRGPTLGTAVSPVVPGLPGVGTSGCPVSPALNLDQIFNNVLNCLMPPAGAAPSPTATPTKMINNMITSIDAFFATSVTKVAYASPTIVADSALATPDSTGVTGRPCIYANHTRTLKYSPVYLEFLINEGVPVAAATALAHEFGHHANRLVGYKPKVQFAEEQRADCFAGAYLASVATEASFRGVARYQLNTYFGKVPSDPGHGTPEQRLKAVFDCYDKGVPAGWI